MQALEMQHVLDKQVIANLMEETPASAAPSKQVQCLVVLGLELRPRSSFELLSSL